MSCFSCSGSFSLDVCSYNASSLFSYSLDMISQRPRMPRSEPLLLESIKRASQESERTWFVRILEQDSVVSAMAIISVRAQLQSMPHGFGKAWGI